MPSPVLSLDARRVAPCSIDEALRRILALRPPPRAEQVKLVQSFGRVAAEAITASHAQPPFDAAAMDGWAVCGEGAGLYRIVGESRAGHGFRRPLERGEAIAISTGAPVPAGNARVVRREDARDRGALVEVDAATAARRDIRMSGSDFAVGAILLAAGRRIGVLDIARLAAARIGMVAVNAAPTVSIIATGDELARHGEPWRDDQICDALSLPILLRAGQAGAVASIQQAVDDDPSALDDAITSSSGDIVVVIGGASGGRHDHARAALGVELVVGVLMRPGKPFWAGHVAGRVVVGLPGNPVAALAAVELFLMPLLHAWQGIVVVAPELTVSCDGLSAGGAVERVQFARRVGSGFHAMALGGGDSAALAPIAGADLLVRIPSGPDSCVIRGLRLD